MAAKENEEKKKTKKAGEARAHEREQAGQG